LNHLVEVAKKENRIEVVGFAEKLKLHARNEEILYPAAILVGEYLKLRIEIVSNLRFDVIYN
jgi:hypothetical protein